MSCLRDRRKTVWLEQSKMFQTHFVYVCILEDFKGFLLLLPRQEKGKFLK